MAISIGQRDEHIERIPRQRKEIVWFWAFTAEARHWPESTRSCYSDQWNSFPRRTGGSRKAIDWFHYPPMRFDCERWLSNKTVNQKRLLNVAVESCGPEWVADRLMGAVIQQSLPDTSHGNSHLLLAFGLAMERLPVAAEVVKRGAGEIVV